jgi:hypothetical protein
MCPGTGTGLRGSLSLLDAVEVADTVDRDLLAYSAGPVRKRTSGN